MAVVLSQEVGDLVFQLGLQDDVPVGVTALVYLIDDEILFPQRDWLGLLYLPIPDCLSDGSPAPFPGIEWLDMAVDGLRHFVKQGWPAAVMCRAGQSRSRMVHIGFWMKSAGMSFQQARAFVDHKRPESQPNSTLNPNFIDGLLVYQTFLNERGCPCDLTFENS
jgi:hypothetical protein